MKTKKLKPSGRRWGIVVGVDNYVNAGEHLRNLQGCVLDANMMYRTMLDKECCGFEEDHVRLLENPTYDQIECAFKDLGGRMKRGDELWFYFAGHGYSERRRKGVSGYLLPSDIGFNADGTLSTRSCISHDCLRDSFIDRHMGHGNITVVLFLDCCCAASVGLCDGSRAAVAANQREVSEGFKESFRDLALVGGGAAPGTDEWDFKYISFMATDKTGKAKEDSSGGVFTKYLIKGLRGEAAGLYDKTDIYIRTGGLGAFLGERVPNQPPIQDFIDTTYPLSVSRERKSRQEEIKQLDSQALSWLTKMIEARLLGVDAQQFAFAIMSEGDVGGFAQAGMLRNLMRLFSSSPNLSTQLEEGANMIKAFFELKTLQDEKESGQRADAATARPHGPAVIVASSSPMTVRDRELLADVARRVGDADDADISDLGRKSQTEAAAALDSLARRRMRQACGRVRYDALFTKNECDDWSMKARKGFSSPFEKAVYELVRDDKALAGKKK